jgi:anti-anti-sigma factor
VVAEAVEKEWTKLVRTLDPPLLVIDFVHLPHASSALLGAIIGLYWQIVGRDGKIRLCNVAPSIMEVFRVTRLQKRLPVDPDLQAAIVFKELSRAKNGEL